MTRKIIGLFIIGFLFLQLIACDTPVESKYTPTLSVQGMLQPFMPTQELYVYQTTSLQNHPVESDSLLVQDAVVTLTDQTSEYNYRGVENLQHPYYTLSTDSLDLRPGHRYRLTVKTPELELHGATTIPEQIAITSPKPFSQLPEGQDVRVKWGIVDYAHGYVLDIYGTMIASTNYITGEPDTSRILYGSFATTDTSYLLSHFLIHPIKPSEYADILESRQTALIIVMAVDRNFYLHQFVEVPTAGLDQGYGYFGSATVDTVQVYLE